MTPSFGKTGSYIQRDKPSHIWTKNWAGTARSDAPDRFEPRNPRTGGGTALDKDLAHKLTEALYTGCVKRLANGKAPGPDDIPNELLKHMPPQLHAVTRTLFALMWRTGHTPDWWKVSNTVFIYKKGDPTSASNYRPVGLANTLYKLWTSVVTAMLTDHAEKYDILSGSQAGFRVQLDTHRQIATLQNAFTDARIYNADKYVSYVDFSAAFNTVEHDTLLQFMWDLGFPTDAIATVKDLYTNAVTRVRINSDLGKNIKVDRGTIQGDSLSPFLFLIYIEYLLRWLAVGERGYRHQCTTDTDVADHKGQAAILGMGRSKEETAAMSRTNNVTYADDITLLAGTKADMQVQLRKIELF
jgi:hypothetical protein